MTPDPQSGPSDYDSLIIQSFGGPEGPEDVMPFLRRVTSGRNIPEERLLAVAEHYYHFGGVSPINAQNRELIKAVQAELARRQIELPVYFGNRNWHPLLEDTVAQMVQDGRRNALSFVTSAFGSASSCRQYRDDIDRAVAAVGEEAPRITKLRLFYDHPGFVAACAARVREARLDLARDAHAGPPSSHLIFTAHSIPVSMPGCDLYRDQLAVACRLVAEELAIGEADYSLAYQSRSGPPSQPWLEPDILDHLDELHGQGIRSVVIFPIGFVSDHIEVLFDLDEEAMARAKELGIDCVRAGAVGTHPHFVEMVVDLVEERLSGREARHLSAPPWPDPDCPADCCRHARALS